MIRQHFIRTAGFLFLFLTLTTAFPQSITSVTIEWNDEFLSKTGQDVLERKTLFRDINEAKGAYRTAIINRLKDYGYFSVISMRDSIEYSPDSASCKLFYLLEPGSRSVISKIIIDRTDSADTNIFAGLYGEPYNRFALEEELLNLLNTNEQDGFPFFAVKIKSIVDREGLLEIYADAIQGPSGQIRKVEITGNQITNADVIIRELRLREKEYYEGGLIQKIPPRLNRLRLFAPVTPPGFYINTAGEGVLTIKVKESQFNNFDGIVGYIPPGDNNLPGYVTGLLNLSFRNIFGTGRVSTFRWQKVDRNTQELEVRYLEPWLFSYPVNVSGGIYQRKQDTTYVQLKFEFLADYMLNENVTLGWQIGVESVVPVRADTLVRFTVFNSEYVNTGVSARYDSRNDPLVPEYGILFYSTFSLHQKKILGPAEFITPSTKLTSLLRKVDTGLDIYQSVIGRQVAAVKLHFRALSGDNNEINDMYKLGGNTNLRGYRENQFLTSRVFLANVEYRFLTGGRTFVYPFFDIAHFLPFSGAATGEAAMQTKLGYGAGVFLETGAGMLRVEYGLAKGDSFSKAKIHFGIVSEF